MITILKVFEKHKPFIISFLFTFFITFMILRFINYGSYTEEYTYQLQEIENGTYVIYYTVSSNVPAHNYEVVTVCTNGNIYTFKGDVNIQQIDNSTPTAKIVSRPHMNYADDVTVTVPKGTVRFDNNVGTK